MVDLAVADVSDNRVEVASGVRIPAAWTAILEGEPDVPGTIRVDITFDRQLGRSAAALVSVGRKAEGDEVTSLTLREVRVQWAVQATGLMVSTVSTDTDHSESGAAYLKRMRDRAERTTDEMIADAATIYRLAAAVSMPPLKTVADNLHVSQSTATRLMNRARVGGLAEGIRLPRVDATGPVVGAPGPTGPSIG
ncbi:hypothetical protein [Microbacterium sulfonylureivorans]|uniref:hypothetical protein n=1 Tax=Microbacterium sulfonylureivorans TaxID=2486854 RepID=UPI000FD94AEE|nr:hypothetical protein [Microbacterium sulfonylureivorans]